MPHKDNGRQEKVIKIVLFQISSTKEGRRKEPRLALKGSGARHKLEKSGPGLSGLRKTKLLATELVGTAEPKSAPGVRLWNPDCSLQHKARTQNTSKLIRVKKNVRHDFLRVLLLGSRGPSTVTLMHLQQTATCGGLVLRVMVKLKLLPGKESRKT